MAIDFKKFIHPEDASALESLKQIPLLDVALKKVMHEFTEDLIHGINMASMIRLGPKQLPELYGLLPEICAKLEIEEPEFYLEMNPLPNAYTTGDTKAFVVINSGIVEMLTREELKAVIAHECGHILCHHVLYHSLASLVATTGNGLLSFLGVNLSAPLEWALLYWVRRSEFSADRVAAYVMDDPYVMAKAMIRIAGGPANITRGVDMDQFLAQAEEFKRHMEKSKKSAALQNWEARRFTHPLTAVRAAEVVQWFKSARLAGTSARNTSGGKTLTLDL